MTGHLRSSCATEFVHTDNVMDWRTDNAAAASNATPDAPGAEVEDTVVAGFLLSKLMQKSANKSSLMPAQTVPVFEF